MPTCELSEAVTLRDLLSHRVCLNDDSVRLTLGSSNDTRSALAQQCWNNENSFWKTAHYYVWFYNTICKSIRYLGKNCSFRSKYKYSNQMYGLAGYVMESLCAETSSCSVEFGDTWESAMYRIFDEIGMEGTFLARDVLKNKDTLEKTEKLALSHY